MSCVIQHRIQVYTRTRVYNMLCQKNTPTSLCHCGAFRSKLVSNDQKSLLRTRQRSTLTLGKRISILKFEQINEFEQLWIKSCHEKKEKKCEVHIKQLPVTSRNTFVFVKYVPENHNQAKHFRKNVALPKI